MNKGVESVIYYKRNWSNKVGLSDFGMISSQFRVI